MCLLNYLFELTCTQVQRAIVQHGLAMSFVDHMFSCSTDKEVKCLCILIRPTARRQKRAIVMQFVKRFCFVNLQQWTSN